MAAGAALCVVTAVAARADLPRPVDPLDARPRVEGAVVAQIRRDGGEGDAPSPRHLELRVKALAKEQRARAWLATVPAAEVGGLDGVTFWIAGAGLPGHAQILLRCVGPGGVPPVTYVSQVHLANPYWHRVFLPFSEFYDPAGEGTYPIPRFTADGADKVEIGIGVDGPTVAAVAFRIDELGLTSWSEVQRRLGWRSYMPPAHGFPLDLERFDGPLAWTASGGATVAGTALHGFPHEGFDKGLAIVLPGPEASVRRVLVPHGALPYYEGFAFWVKGDGGEHVLRLTFAGKEGRTYAFTTPVRGDAWRLVFCGFENFKMGLEPFEVDEVEEALLSIALDAATPAPAQLTLGPFRLGYEK